MKGEEVVNIANNVDECPFCSRDWLKFKKELNNDQNDFNMFFSNVGGVAFDRLKIEKCISKNI